MIVNSFYLKVIASDKKFFEGKCKSLVVPLMDGEKCVLPHHEDMVIATVIGEIRILTEEDATILGVIGSGFVQIVNNRVTLLVDTAERPEDIDIRRAEEALERAEEQLRQKQSIQQHSHSEASLARAISRLRLKNKYLGR